MHQETLRGFGFMAKEITTFGVMPSGEKAELLTLDNGIISCRIITYGAVLQSLFVPDKDGNPVDVVLGCDTLDAYRAHNDYMGAIVGRYANRIAKGKFFANGKEYTLAVNSGPNHIHGGVVGFSHSIWKVEELTDTCAVLSIFSGDGDEGYPGNLTLSVTYELSGRELRIKYNAVCDQDTPCNITNHAYFNLGGQDSGPVLDQMVAIYADYFTPSDADGLPTGILECVEGTPMDLRRPTRIGSHIDDKSFEQLRQSNGYDHNFAVSDGSGALRTAAWASSSKTGISMTVRSTYPGVQLYTANFLEENHPGKNGCVYGARHAFCLEAEFFPDSPNKEVFPGGMLKAGERYIHETHLSF